MNIKPLWAGNVSVKTYTNFRGSWSSGGKAGGGLHGGSRRQRLNIKRYQDARISSWRMHSLVSVEKKRSGRE